MDAAFADDIASSVFAGLVPRTISPGTVSTGTCSTGTGATGIGAVGIVGAGETMPDRDRSRLAKGVLGTVPILLVGSVAAMTLNLTAPADTADAKSLRPNGYAGQNRVTASTTAAASSAPALLAAPPMYSVAVGDTISDIATRFGLSTASVLALNGLSWSSLIFPGQELTLTSGHASRAEQAVDEEPADASPSGRYTIVSGDTISAIADRFGVSTLSLLGANGLGWASIVYPGQVLVIPGLVGPGTPEPDAVAPIDLVPVDAVPVSSVRDDHDVHGSEPIAQAPAAGPVADPGPAPIAPSPPAAPAQGGSYTIQSGDTLSSIAARFGVGTQALLDANGLDWSSVIYSGHTLVIPGIAPASSGGPVTVLNDDMRSNAQVIVQVGRDLGVPDYGIVIALATAMQESSLRNIAWGDLDSVGLFQQRPSSGWGSIDLLTTPSYAARLFYGGPGNPNAGYTRGLLDIPGWQSMSVTQAAQRVQISAYPDAYAKWEPSARSWLAQLS